MRFERPIPGQSLTTPEKSSPYEKPPEISNALDALDVHIDRLNNTDVIEGITNMLESDIDVVTAVEGILRSAVLQGIHSLDISILIAPHIHEYIKGQAEVLKLDYDEGFEDIEASNRLKDRAVGERIMKDINLEMATPTDDLEQATPEVMGEAESPAPVVEEEPSQGLMARRTA